MRKCLFRAISASLAAMLLLAPAAARATRGDEAVTLYVFDRPPYYHLEHGQPVGGFLLILAQVALDRAGVSHAVREMPPGRILATFESEDVNACAVGWLETPARGRFARFSAPIYYNKPLGAAVSAAAPDVGAGANTLDQLLRHKKWNWGLRLGFSYGPALDAAFTAAPEGAVARFSDPAIMLRLLARGRLDAILIEPEELAWLLSREPQLAGAVRFVPLADAPPRLARHIMCDDTVPPAVMERIDAAIDELIGPAADRARRDFAKRH